MDQLDMQEGGGATLIAPSSTASTDFLAGDVMTQLWDDDAGVATMAAKKKKPAKKPARKPARKPTKKPRPTKNRPGCFTTSPCATSTSAGAGRR